MKKLKITYGLIGLNIIFYLISAYFSGNLLEIDIRVLVFLGAKVNALIDMGEYYRLITCMFLHGNVVHLILNMYALYCIGPITEEIYGKRKYIIIYFVSGIISSLFSYSFSEGISIGASGAIFGVLGAAFYFALKMRRTIGRDFLRSIGSALLINIVIGLSVSNVDNFGHFGGVVGGIIISVVLGFRKF